MPGHRPAPLHAAPTPGARPRRRRAQDGVARLLAWPPPLGLSPGLGDPAQALLRAPAAPHFGWMKTVGGGRKLRFVGRERNRCWLELTAAAYNLVRMARRETAAA